MSLLRFVTQQRPFVITFISIVKMLVLANSSYWHLKRDIILSYVAKDYKASVCNEKSDTMRCDNYCPRCGSLKNCYSCHIWILQFCKHGPSTTPSSPNIFPLPNIYANMDYLKELHCWTRTLIMDNLVYLEGSEWQTIKDDRQGSFGVSLICRKWVSDLV